MSNPGSVEFLERAEMGARGLAGSQPVTPASHHADLLRFAPTMPPGFFGRVTFAYQSGRLVSAEIAETLKPEPVSRG